jgi:hypothetical protein
MNNKKILENIHDALASELLRKISDGTATATELNVARQFLKDNGVDCAIDTSKPMLNLAKIMPFDEEEAA